MFKKILFIVLLLTHLISCNSIKYVQDNESLLKENRLVVNQEEIKNPELKKYFDQKPNRTALGAPLSLYIYNLGNPDFETTFEEWQANHPKKYRRLESVFSKKQTYVVYSNTKGVNNWFLTKGEAPVIFDPRRARKTSNTLRDYYISKGFFEAEVNYHTDSIGPKQLAVTYDVNTKNQYYLDTISAEIESPVLDSLYNTNLESSFLKALQNF